MSYPPLVNYQSAVQYKTHFENVYCRKPITTFDGIQVRFRKKDFNHCFFESARLRDDTFSKERAVRIDWIKTALQDPMSERYLGWNKKRKRYEKNRRVVLVQKNYVVVISLKTESMADFVTAYVADSEYTIMKIKSSPKWT